MWLQILVENFCDPAHVPFAHHGVQGNRCSLALLLPLLCCAAWFAAGSTRRARAASSKMCCRYSETAGYVKLEPTADFTADGVSFDARMRMFNPKNESLTHIQFFAPTMVRYFTPRDGVRHSTRL